jgi:hypothetical protein
LAYREYDFADSQCKWLLNSLPSFLIIPGIMRTEDVELFSLLQIYPKIGYLGTYFNRCSDPVIKKRAFLFWHKRAEDQDWQEIQTDEFISYAIRLIKDKEIDSMESVRAADTVLILFPNTGKQKKKEIISALEYYYTNSDLISLGSSYKIIVLKSPVAKLKKILKNEKDDEIKTLINILIEMLQKSEDYNMSF